MSDTAMDWLIGTVIAVVLALGIVGSIAAQAQWEEYAAAHHCKAVGKKDGQVGTGITSNGKLATTVTADQTIYNCDNGEIRIR